MVTTRQKICCWLLFLMLVLPAAVCQAAPSLLGTWQGTIPAIDYNSCFNNKCRIVISRQCGNLFQGRITIATTTIDVVGSILQGTAIHMHGVGLSLFGDYQPGSPPAIRVTNLTPITDNTVYDTFQAPYTGMTNNVAPFVLLLFDK